MIVVYAKTEPEKGSKGISAFIVESKSKGFACARKLDKLGMRGSNTGELVFDGVFVPRKNLVGKENEGVRVLMEGLDIERLVLSAGPLGYVNLETVLYAFLSHMRTKSPYLNSIVSCKRPWISSSRTLIQDDSSMPR